MCDFQAIYRIRIDPDSGDLAGLSGPQFFRLATRLPAYSGAVQAQLRALGAERAAGTPAATNPGPAAQTLDATPLMLTTHPLLAQFCEYSTASPSQ